jgi:hypothetical protein
MKPIILKNDPKPIMRNTDQGRVTPSANQKSCIIVMAKPCHRKASIDMSNGSTPFLLYQYRLVVVIAVCTQAFNATNPIGAHIEAVAGVENTEIGDA